MAKSFKIFYNIVKLTALVLCIGLFLLLMSGIWAKFISEETTVTVKLEIGPVEEKLPPCVTVCPFKAFKRPGKFIQNLDSYATELLMPHVA